MTVTSAVIGVGFHTHIISSIIVHVGYERVPTDIPFMLQASIGISTLLVAAMEQEGITKKSAEEKIWLIDKYGLLVEARIPSLAILRCVNSRTIFCFFT